LINDLKLSENIQNNADASLWYKQNCPAKWKREYHVQDPEYLNMKSKIQLVESLHSREDQDQTQIDDLSQGRKLSELNRRMVISTTRVPSAQCVIAKNVHFRVKLKVEQF
jgi:hypothetical protein